MFRTTLGWQARITIVHYNLAGQVIREAAMRNLITDVGLQQVARALRGVGETEIFYLAWGTSSTAPAVGDTKLVAEAGRKQITNQAQGPGGSDETLTTTYLAPADANVAIEELGWFAGGTATAAADTGKLLARVLYSYPKTNLESIQIDRTDTFARL